MRNLVILSIFLIPLASLLQINGTIIWYSQYLMFLVLGFGIISMQISKLSKPLAILSFYLLFSYILVTHQNARAGLCMTTGYLGIIFISEVSKLKNRKPIYYSIIFFSLIQTIYVILQAFNIDPFFHLITNSHRADTVGFVGSHNQLGLYYAAVMPFIGPISIIPIFFSRCSSAAIGMLVGAFCMFKLLNFERLTVLLICVVVLIALFWKHFDNIDKNVIRERVEICKLTIKQIVKGRALVEVSKNIKQVVTCNPLFGFGIGSFMQISPLTQADVLDIGLPEQNKAQHRYEHAHNDFIEADFDLGHIGLMIVIACILEVLILFFTVKNKSLELIMVFCSLISQGVSSMGVYSIHAPVSYFMFCLMLGLFFAEVNHVKNS